MKRFLISLALLLGCSISFGAELSPELATLKEKLSSTIKIGSVNIDTIRDDNGNKIEVIKFHTYQDERDKDLNFRMRVTVEMTDKSDQTCFAQINREQGAVHEEYTGEDDWEFQLPYGDLERPKVSAYAIQYGIFDAGQFIPVVEAFKNCDSAEEITARTACRANFSQTLHYYWFRNLDDEVVSSNPN